MKREQHGLTGTYMYRQFHKMKRRAKLRREKGEQCEVLFSGLLDFQEYALANGWYEGCLVCRIGDTGNYEKGNIRFDTAQSNVEEAFAKTYKFIDPDGEVREIYDLAAFCRSNGLSNAHMGSVAKGNRKQHKGWRKF